MIQIKWTNHCVGHYYVKTALFSNSRNAMRYDPMHCVVNMKPWFLYNHFALDITYLDSNMSWGSAIVPSAPFQGPIHFSCYKQTT